METGATACEDLEKAIRAAGYFTQHHSSGAIMCGPKGVKGRLCGIYFLLMRRDGAGYIHTFDNATFRFPNPGQMFDFALELLASMAGGSGTYVPRRLIEKYKLIEIPPQRRIELLRNASEPG